MRKLVLLFAILALVFSLSAQVKEAPMNMVKGKENAFSILLKQTNKKEVEKAWTKYIKEFDGKTKRNKKTGFIFSDNAEIEKMSSNTVDVYATITPSGADTDLTVWFDLGGAYLSSEMHGDKATVAKSILDEFALSVSKAAVEEELKEEQKALKKLNADLSDLKKDKDGFESDIEKYKKKIAEAEANIKQNIKEQGDKEASIKEQEEVVEKVKDKLKKLD